MRDPILDIPDTPMQRLLDEEATASNSGRAADAELIRTLIRKDRGTTPPPCFGHDDCSTVVLIQCPWRFDCGQ